jgi:UDP-GlcNAc3NAcA epimerase
VVAVVGARPQFVKLSPFAKAAEGRLRVSIVHTGQHYDSELSAVFFEQLSLPPADFNLGVGSGTHGAQTAAMLSGIEQVLMETMPMATIVFGDTNSTLAGSLASAKLGVPVAHIEAGLRSWNRGMPEEINRVLTDHVSTWLFAPSRSAAANLHHEGVRDGVHVVGDVMYDAVLQHAAVAGGQVPELSALDGEDYYLATVHRAENTDDPRRLQALLTALGGLSLPVVLPLHPRTEARISAYELDVPEGVLLIAPLGYFDMLRVLRESRCVITDSGGVQKEAFYLRRPCVTVRQETEWPETVTAGWNAVVDVQRELLEDAIDEVCGQPKSDEKPYGDGQAAPRIVEALVTSLLGSAAASDSFVEPK